MAVAITVNDVDKTSQVLVGSVSVSLRRNERATASFAATTRYATGQKVGIFDGGVRRFGGTIDQIEDIAAPNAPYSSGHATAAALEYRYSCVGWEQILDRRIVDGAVYGGFFFADAGTDVFTANGHGLSTNQVVQVATSDTLPSGLSASTTYYAVNVTTNTFKLSASSGGAAIDITTDGTGAHRFLWRSTDIVTHLIANYAAGESITTGGVAAGPFVEKQIFDFVKVSEAISTVASIVEYEWFIDPSLVLYFQSAGWESAPFVLIYTSSNVFDLSVVRETREDYRNRQRLRIGTPVNQSDAFSGDGSTTLFWLTARPLEIVQLQNNALGTTFSVGIYGQDTGTDFYWSPGEQLLIQDAGGTPIPGGESLLVVYRAIGDDMVIYDDTAQQTARASVEGNSGIYDRVDDAPSFASSDLATGYAATLTSVYQMVKEITFRSANTSFRPSQIMNANLPAHGISLLTGYYVQSVELTTEDNVMYSQVVVNNGFLSRTAADVFGSFQGGGISSVGGIGGAGGAGASTVTVESATLTANATLNGPGVPADGAILVYVVTQNATGGWTVTWGTDFDASVNYAPNDSANAVTTYMFFGSGGKWYKFESGSIR